LFSWKTLKISLEVRKRYKSRFSAEIQNFDRENFKGLSPFTTPFRKEKVLLVASN